MQAFLPIGFSLFHVICIPFLLLYERDRQRKKHGMERFLSCFAEMCFSLLLLTTWPLPEGVSMCFLPPSQAQEESQFPGFQAQLSMHVPDGVLYCKCLLEHQGTFARGGAVSPLSWGSRKAWGAGSGNNERKMTAKWASFSALKRSLSQRAFSLGLSSAARGAGGWKRDFPVFGFETDISKMEGGKDLLLKEGFSCFRVWNLEKIFNPMRNGAHVERGIFLFSGLKQKRKKD